MQVNEFHLYDFATFVPACMALWPRIIEQCHLCAKSGSLLEIDIAPADRSWFIVSFVIILFPATCFFVERSSNTSYNPQHVCKNPNQYFYKHAEARIMGDETESFNRFAQWSSVQVSRARDYVPIPEPSLNAVLREQWDRRTDQQDYLQRIDAFEATATSVKTAILENDPTYSVPINPPSRKVRRGKSRTIAVALNNYRKALVPLNRVQKASDRNGQIISFPELIRYHDRQLEEVDREVTSSREEAVDEGLEEMLALAPDMPDDMQAWITRAYEALPWAELAENEETDHDVSRQITAEISHSQEYNDLQLLNWDDKTPVQDILRSFRSLGRVRCGGHVVRNVETEDARRQRTSIRDEWQKYFVLYARDRNKPVPVWVMVAAKSRAEMAWDHNNGTIILPPARDHSNLGAILEQLFQAENNFFEVSRLEAHLPRLS